MAKQQSIVTSPQLIKLLGEKLYDNKLDFILIRELLQNAIDASSDTEVSIKTTWEENTFTIIVSDSGIGMSEQTLLDVFLSIGSSYKPDSNGSSVGGFGIAKVALFSCDKWAVYSRDNYIDQALVHRKVPYRQGTVVKATIKFETDVYSWQKRKALSAIYTSDFRLPVVHNNIQVENYSVQPTEEHTTGADIPFSLAIAEGTTIIDEHGYSGYKIARINGLTQYVSFASSDLDTANKNLVVDLYDIGYAPRDKSYPFSLSREYLCDDINQVVTTWINQLSKDTKSKLDTDKRENEQMWFDGRRCLWAMSNDGGRYEPSDLDWHIGLVWKQIVYTITGDESILCGITNDESCLAMHKFSNGCHHILINTDMFQKEMNWSFYESDTNTILLYLWHLAVHELSHRYHQYHDENFSSYESTLARQSASDVTHDSTKIKALIRRAISTYKNQE